jgi:glycosyltransferase involved in cell wall biosynthesis
MENSRAESNRPLGVSVVICTHNGASRIVPSLRALAAQRNTEGIKWEVLVIDNRSSDNLIEVLDEWRPAFRDVCLRVIPEIRSGTAFARQKGMAQSLYEFISFVDDDNDVEELWVRKVFELMLQHPEVGAAGGRNIGSFEKDPPAWCKPLVYSLAVGVQSQVAGVIDTPCPSLWTSGMTLRWTAWRDATQRGFHPIIAGRKGGGQDAGAMMPGEDTELSYALAMCGWKLWNDHDLTQLHRIPAGRLQWHYFRRLYRGFGMSDVPLAPYRQQLGHPRVLTTDSWVREVGRLIWQLAGRKNWYGWYCRLAGKEGSYSVLGIEKLLGSLSMLLRLRGEYGDMCARVREFSARCKMSCTGVN